MKKIVFFLCLAFSSVIVFAQEDPKFGVKAGVNVSTLTGGGRESKIGFHAGGLAHLHLSPQFSLQPEVVFSGQGAKYTLVNGEEHELALNYVNVPILLQYNFSNGFRLQAGPQIGFLVDVKDKVNDVETGFFTSSDFNTVDLSLPVGLSYLGNSGFGVDARYNIGLNNINKVGSIERKNNVFQVGAFYLFDHSHKSKSR